VLDYARNRDGAQIAFRVIGELSLTRTVVYVPGLLYPIEVIDDDPPYARFLHGLAAIGRVVVIERRGIGASDPIDWESDVFCAWADDVVAVLDALDVERTAIVGYASGARVALAAAARHPERIDGVVALHVGVAMDDIGRVERNVLRVGLAAAVDRDSEVAASMRATTDPSRAADRAYQEWFERGGRLGAGPHAAASFWRAVLADTDDYRALLGAIRAPTLVLHRAEQRLLPLDASRLLADAIPTGEFRAIPGPDLSPNCGDVDALVGVIAEFLTGETITLATDRPLRALLFTDLVGSTATLSEVGDARWRQMLDLHDGLVRKALERHGGRVVKSTGDGVLAVFDNASRALRGATDLRSAVATIGLKVRAGVHVAEVEIRGDDVAGLGVHVAARIMGLAEADEILVSGAVAQVAMGGDSTFDSIGPRELRGIDRPVELARLISRS
jgi:class 3 adenylate cyclase/alpha-beta hydrolase superfamily lysophospholipase